MAANIETLPCFSSVSRLLAKFKASPSWLNPAGSQKPTGAWTPSSLSKAFRATVCVEGAEVEEPTSLAELAAVLLRIAARLAAATPAAAMLETVTTEAVELTTGVACKRRAP